MYHPSTLHKGGKTAGSPRGARHGYHHGNAGMGAIADPMAEFVARMFPQRAARGMGAGRRVEWQWEGGSNIAAPGGGPQRGTSCTTSADCPGDTCFCDTAKGLCYTDDPVGCLGLTAGEWRLPSQPGGTFGNSCSVDQVLNGCCSTISPSGEIGCDCPCADVSGTIAWQGGGRDSTTNQCRMDCDSSEDDFFNWQDCRDRCGGLRSGGFSNCNAYCDAKYDEFFDWQQCRDICGSMRMGGGAQVHMATVVQQPQQPQQPRMATMASFASRRRGLTRKGMGARSYANRALGDQMSVDVQRVADGNWRATVNANGGYAQRVFGNHFQVDVQGGDGQYHGSVSTRAPHGMAGVQPWAGGYAGRLTPRRTKTLKGLGARRGIGEQHGSYGNWVGTMDLAGPYYMRGRRAVWTG